ncbi:MAG: hypothetical protein Q9217_000795 [Psora testacea]
MATKKDSPSVRHTSPSIQDEQASLKKRRKVNHGLKSEPENGSISNGGSLRSASIPQDLLSPSFEGQPTEKQLLGDTGTAMGIGLTPDDVTQAMPQSMQQTSVPPSHVSDMDDPNQQWYGTLGFEEQNNPRDMHDLYPPYMFNAPDIGSEYNVLNNFLNTSLLDEGLLSTGDDIQVSTSERSSSNNYIANARDFSGGNTELKQLAQSMALGPPSFALGGSISRPRSVRPPDKEEEKLYMKIADPSGNDKPEERMKKLLEAKYAAGLLRPFNYVQGYARLNAYLEKNMQPASRQRMIRQLDKFRPKFREKMQSLTDMELTMVEMWFERTLMEYDRVFASMAIPACCWRRTGEIFRGNKEMAELIHVPIEKLLDGKLALHEIITEEDLVGYWNNFLAIAFDNTQKAVLTMCTLRKQDSNAIDLDIRCCFSFTLMRDIVFAKQLEQALEKGFEPSLPLPELYDAIDKITTVGNRTAAHARVELDKVGTRLWNLAIKLKARVAERTEYECLDLGQLSLAETVVEKAAFYDERLRRASSGNKVLISGLSCDYLFLRITLAWRRGRLDVAKLMLGKVIVTADPLGPALAEQLADVTYEIGKDQLKQELYTEAIFWFDRACGALSGSDIGAMSCAARDLKVSTMHNMIRALMHLQGDDNRIRAWNFLRDLEFEHGERLAVLLLKLELHATESGPSPQEYSRVLRKIVDTVHLTESNIKTILYHIHRLRSWSPTMTHSVLIYFISEKLLGAEQRAWVEKTLITTVWNCTSSPDIPGLFDSLAQLFRAIASELGHALSTSTAHAAQILLWRRIELSYQQHQYDISAAWCKLSLHEIFSNSGAKNVGKLQRKLILCALSQAGPDKACELCANISASNLKEPSTQYLLYKVALRSQESEKAIECLDYICKATTEDATILYACVLEAQKSGDQTQSAACLMRLLEKFRYGAPDGVHLPALLRCTARLLIQQFGTEAKRTEDILKDICKVFDSAARQAQDSRRVSENSRFTIAELNWFSRNSYNLALKSCIQWPPETTSSLIASCVQFIDLYPPGLNPHDFADLSLRKLFCNFLTGSLSTLRARQEDVIEVQLQHYLEVRRAADAFRVHFEDQMDHVGKGAKDDLRQKYNSLLAYDYEAATHLKAWESLESIIKVQRLLCV